MERNLLGMPPIKREGQEISRRCDMQCDGVRMEKEIDKLREALKFYANEDHYEPKKVWTTSMPQYEPDGYKLVTPVLADKGTKARQALEETK